MPTGAIKLDRNKSLPYLYPKDLYSVKTMMRGYPDPKDVITDMSLQEIAHRLQYLSDPIAETARHMLLQAADLLSAAEDIMNTAYVDVSDEKLDKKIEATASAINQLLRGS